MYSRGVCKHLCYWHAIEELDHVYGCAAPPILGLWQLHSKSMGDSSRQSIGAANSALSEPPSRPSLTRRGSLVGALPTEPHASLTGARVGRRASEFGLSLGRILEQHTMASPNAGAADALGTHHTTSLVKTPTNPLAFEPGSAPPVSAARSTRSTIDPALAPDIRNLFAKVIFSGARFLSKSTLTSDFQLFFNKIIKSMHIYKVYEHINMHICTVTYELTSSYECTRVYSYPSKYKEYLRFARAQIGRRCYTTHSVRCACW